MSENPYASPSATADVVLSPEFSVDTMEIASQGRRFLSLILDSIIMEILAWIAGFIFGISFVILSGKAFGGMTPQDEFLLNVMGFILGLCVRLAYYLGMEAMFQRTVAKYLTGTIVVTADGKRPTVGQIVGRSFARFIPFEPFSFLGREPIGWHDSLSGTARGAGAVSDWRRQAPSVGRRQLDAAEKREVHTSRVHAK